MEPIAAGDESALDPPRPPVLCEGDVWRVGFDVVQRNGLCIPDNLKAAAGCCLDQILRQLRLAINHHSTTRKIKQVNAYQSFPIAEIHTVVRQAFCVKPLA
jgi:hypothetical protein